jgi:hypothetical protein
VGWATWAIANAHFRRPPGHPLRARKAAWNGRKCRLPGKCGTVPPLPSGTGPQGTPSGSRALARRAGSGNPQTDTRPPRIRRQGWSRSGRGALPIRTRQRMRMSVPASPPLPPRIDGWPQPFLRALGAGRLIGFLLR